MFWAINSPILRSTFDCIYSFRYNAPTLLPTGDTAEMELKIKRSINGICCILLVAYIIVLMMHGHTDIKFKYYMGFV
jgi:hypothetical protein